MDPSLLEMPLYFLPPELQETVVSLLPLASRAALWEAFPDWRACLSTSLLYSNVSTIQLLNALHGLGWHGLAYHLLSSGVLDPNETSHESHTCSMAPPCRGKSALQVVAARGWTDSVSLLMSSPLLNPNWSDRWGRSALHRAVEEEQGEVILLLLRDPRINPNQQDNVGLSPLHVAVLLHLPHFAALLLAHTAIDPNIRDFPSGLSPVHMAAREGQVEMLDLICSHPKVDPNLLDRAGRTALHLAAYPGNLPCLALLLSMEGVLVNQIAEQEGEGVLHRACRAGALEEVELLLDEKSLDCHLEDSEGRTGLMVAAMEGRLGIVQILLRARRFRMDIDVNAEDKKGRSAVHLACSRGRGEIVRMLVEEGAHTALIDGWDG